MVPKSQTSGGSESVPAGLLCPKPCEPAGLLDRHNMVTLIALCFTCQINAVRARAEMNERVPEDYELFPTEVDARVAAARFNARNGYGRRAAAVSQHARGWVVVICQYTPVGYLSQVDSE